MNQQEEKSGRSFETEQEKEAYIDKFWKKADMRIAIRIGFAVTGVTLGLIIWDVCKDSIPEWLIEACSHRRGGNMLALIGSGVGLFAGEIVSKFCIRIMKLED